MTTKSIWTSLFFAGFCACIHTAPRHEYPPIAPVHPGVSRIDGRYRIDTATILANKNLQPFLEKLETMHLAQKTSVSDIPAGIKSFLINATDDHFSIANPGDDWQAGCINFKDLPSRHLVYLGTGSDIVLMTYYTGGIGVIQHVLMFQCEGSTILDFWCGTISTDITNQPDIIQFLKQHKDEPWGLNTNLLFL